MAVPDLDSAVLDPETAALYLCIAPEQLEKLRRGRRGPAYCKMGRSITYRRQDLDDFVKKSLRPAKIQRSSDAEIEAVQVTG